MKRHAILVRLLDVSIVLAAALTLLTLSLDRLDLNLGGVRLRVSQPSRPLLALAMAIVGRWWLGWRRETAGTGRAATVAASCARLGFIAFFVAWSITCVYFGVRSCGGLDSYGYVGAASLLASGALREDQPIASLLPFEGAADAAAPLGFVVGADGHSRVPRFPLGLPLVMAIFMLAGPEGPFWVPPIMALAALGAAWAMAKRDGDTISGWFAAAVLASSPTFVDMAIQPMSDVPATAWVLAAVMFLGSPLRPILAGICAGMAVLTRPALLPAAGALLLVLAWRRRAWRPPGMPDSGPGLGDPARLRPTWKTVAAFAASFATFALIQGALNQHLYGDPASSGYGRPAALLDPSRALTNVATFAKWVTYSHTPVVWLAWATGLLLLRGRGWAGASSLIAAAVALPYFLYFTWDDWEAMRFILPGLALVLIVGSRGVDVLVGRATATWRPLVLLTIALALATGSYAFLARRDVFTLWRAESKYPIVGAWLRQRTPARAVVFSGLHSGSIRYYAGRETVRWDQTPGGALVPSVTSLIDAGYPVYLALDVPSEAERFTARFRDDLRRLSLVPGVHIADADIYELRPAR